MSLLRYFKMDDNAASKVVRDYTHTENGTSVRNTSAMTAVGMVGSSLTFDGADDEIDTGSDMIKTTAITFCAWLFPKGWGEQNVGKIIENGKFSLLFKDTNASILFSSNNFGTTSTSANNSISLNSWQFVVITRLVDGTANFWINGIRSGTSDQNSGAPALGTNNVIIGNNNAGARAFDGMVDELRIYDEVLTAAQIYDLYLADVTKFETNPIVINAFGNDIIISDGPVTVSSIVLDSASAGDTAVFIDRSGNEAIRLANNYGDDTNHGSVVWSPPRGKPFKFDGLRFDDSASGLGDGDYVFVYLK